MAGTAIQQCENSEVGMNIYRRSSLSWCEGLAIITQCHYKASGKTWSGDAQKCLFNIRFELEFTQLCLVGK